MLVDQRYVYHALLRFVQQFPRDHLAARSLGLTPSALSHMLASGQVSAPVARRLGYRLWARMPRRGNS